MSIDPALLERGNVWLVRFDPVKGHEQGSDCPCAIASGSPFNTPGRALVAIVPVSSRISQHRLSVHMIPPEGGMIIPSDALCGQVRTVSLGRPLTHVGMLTPRTMRLVSIRLRIYLDI